MATLDKTRTNCGERTVTLYRGLSVVCWLYYIAVTYHLNSCWLGYFLFSAGPIYLKIFQTWPHTYTEQILISAFNHSVDGILFIISKGAPTTGHEGPALSWPRHLDGVGWSAPHPGRFTPGKETRYPLYRRLGGPPGPVWTGTENLSPTGIRSPDRPAHSESPYRVRYSGHCPPTSHLQCLF